MAAPNMLLDPLNRSIVNLAANLREAMPQTAFIDYLQDRGIGSNVKPAVLEDRLNTLRRYGHVPFERVGHLKRVHIVPPGDGSFRDAGEQPEGAISQGWVIDQVHRRSGNVMSYRRLSTLAEALALCERLNSAAGSYEYIVDVPHA